MSKFKELKVSYQESMENFKAFKTHISDALSLYLDHCVSSKIRLEMNDHWSPVMHLFELEKNLKKARTYTHVVEVIKLFESLYCRAHKYGYTFTTEEGKANPTIGRLSFIIGMVNNNYNQIDLIDWRKFSY